PSSEKKLLLSRFEERDPLLLEFFMEFGPDVLLRIEDGTNHPAGKSGSAADAPDQAKVAAAIESFRELVAKDPNALTAVIEALKEIAAGETAAARSGPKRAICLAGGGPAAGVDKRALPAPQKRESGVRHAPLKWCRWSLR